MSMPTLPQENNHTVMNSEMRSMLEYIRVRA